MPHQPFLQFKLKEQTNTHTYLTLLYYCSLVYFHIKICLQSIFLLSVVVFVQCKCKNTACIIMNISLDSKIWPTGTAFKITIWYQNTIFSESDGHEDCRQKLTFQPHVCSEGSQSNRPQSGLLPAIPAPQRQSADWQEVIDDGGRKLGQPTGTRFWAGEHRNMFMLNPYVWLQL